MRLATLQSLSVLLLAAKSFKMSSSMATSILLDPARGQSELYANGALNGQWEHFEYGCKLAMSRWTALRMAIEGEWGGGDTRRKYEILLEEILHVFKFNRVVYADDLSMNIEEYVENEFGLLCEDGSIEELSNLLVALAEDCKKGNFDKVRALHEQVRSMIPIDLKSAKRKNQFETTEDTEMDTEGAIGEAAGQEQVQEEEQTPDGWATVRRSSRRRAQPKFYDPAVQFPGAQ